ncbi:MAG: ATP-binding protein [Planctomycetales bacterium]|nr:ATP-binding protein [Planctomycetales bacterium]
METATDPRLEALRATTERLAKQQAALVTLTRDRALQSGDLQEVLRHMTEVDAHTLGVERVSVWRYSPDGSAIRALELFELSRGRHSSGTELLTRDYPSYFRALARMDVIPADDACTDSRTCEFAAGYLRPLGITSMMDAPVHLRSGLAGVLCHEHVGPARRWAPDEQNFAVAMANLVSLVIEQDDHRRTDEKLRRASAAAESANRELEAFSYSVSHDLRAPLQTMDGFGELLLEDCGGRLDERGKTYIGHIREGAQRMALLIDRLLELSRVGRAEVARVEVDLSAIARGVLDELRAADPRRVVEAVVRDGVAARGDPVLLKLVLRNLLGNAWKFTGKKATARIEFGVEDAAGERVFFVRDNGAGFDMAYADKLFRPFQRLHGDEEFAGTGVGLATVLRIVHRHGGRVWAEAVPDRGATLRFTLAPPAPPAHPAHPAHPER